MFKLILFNIILILSLIALSRAQGFSQDDEIRYLSDFDKLIGHSYSVPLPLEIKTKCKSQGQVVNPSILSIKSSMTSDALQTFCGKTSICTIPAGLTVTMTSNLNVAALVVQGTLEWNDTTQITNDLYLCAGYIAVKNIII
jgi:hypothetical protein